MTYTYKGVELEERTCPHCGEPLAPWLAPPESGWGIIVACDNNECPHYVGSECDILNKRDDSNLGCRYAENPDNNYTPFNLLAWTR